MDHASPGDYVGQVILTFPSSTQNVEATLNGSPMTVAPDRKRRKLVLDRVHYSQKWGGDFELDNDDDAGQYRLEIRVDDVLLRAVEFEVTKDTR